MQSLLDEEDARAEDNDDETDEVEGEDEWKELFAKPIVEERVISTAGTRVQRDRQPEEVRDMEEAQISTTTTTATTTTSTPTPTTAPSSTLRNRQPTQEPPSNPPATATAKTTGRRISPSPHHKDPKLEATEQSLSTQRLEQEDLTSSLLSLASQLKASSQSFQSTLDNEKSVLDRAVTGMDKTTSTMEAAGQRMGMLRKMSEGKGWWGRMMLYGWIFGLWLVAVLIVFVGPKMRF